MKVPISNLPSSLSSYSLVLEQLADALEAGVELEVERLLAQHPDHADELAQILPTLRALVAISNDQSPHGGTK